MRISFNVQQIVSNDLLIKIIAVMQGEERKVTKRSLKEFIELSLKTQGYSFIESKVESLTMGMSYPQIMAAWAVATGMVVGGIDIPKQGEEIA